MVHPEEKARISFMPSLEEVLLGDCESFRKTLTRIRMRVRMRTTSKSVGVHAGYGWLYEREC